MARAFRVPFAFFPSFLLVSLFLHFYDSCNIARAGNWLMDSLRSVTHTATSEPGSNTRL
ncbi:hypothetical protein FOMA001_g10262 [Fusarium oxysporum f. sp. matthiolae]|nr:hypothetical protein FOMA001_g10262 [Fusarium oxysporum f. sp. matthiolae]